MRCKYLTQVKHSLRTADRYCRHKALAELYQAGSDHQAALKHTTHAAEIAHHCFGSKHPCAMAWKEKLLKAEASATEMNLGQ